MTDFAHPSAGARAASPRPDKHIVDVLIEERAPKLSKSPAWPLVRPPIYQILNHRKALGMADAIAPMGGRAALDHISAILRLDVRARGIERTPQSGSFLVMANHPTGITDGIAAFDVLIPRRPDLLIYANSDAHRVCARFDEILIPVEWVLAKRTRERTRLTLKMTNEAVAAGRPIVIFPAGRLARMRDGLLTDPEWMATGVSLARKFSLPILPIHVRGPYAFWFHFFDKFSGELRDMTLFHELLNKEGKTYNLTFGPLIPPEHVAGDATSVTRKIKRYVERVLGEDSDATFDPDGPECAWRDPASAQTFAQG
ncbi:MAG: acyltransferase [Alphaproteobacteria bacterium]|nr:acyltransferase [Alphaproteobacteria bacterium]